MNLLSPGWWVTMFINVFITMIFIYLIKKAMEKVNVPVVADIAKEV